MDINKIAILGTGAVGAAIAHQLQNDNIPNAVTVIADGDRAANYRNNGFIVNGDSINPAVADSGNYDLIILATKSYHLNEALILLDTCIGDKTLIMSLMNGIASETILGERYGCNRVIPAMILGIDALRNEEGIRYLNKGRIFYGANPEARNQDEALSGLTRWFERTGLGHVLSEEITKTLWHKFMINVGINQVSAVLGSPYGRFQQEGEARELMLGAVREVVALSKLEGTGLDENSIEQWLEVLAALNPEGKTSMYQDAEAGRKMEIDLFADTVITLAEYHNLEVPVNRDLRKRLQDMEKKRRLKN